MDEEIFNKSHSYFHEIHRMIEIDHENNTFSIAKGYTIDDVMYKLAYYERIECQKSISTYLTILDKYRIRANNFDEFQRIFDAYTMPIEEFLKDVENCNTRMRNALKKANIEQVCDLIDNGEYSSNFSMIKKIPGIGKEPYRNIYRALHRLRTKAEFGESEWMIKNNESKKSFTKEK